MMAKIIIEDALSLKGMLIGFIAGTGAEGSNEQKLLFCQNLMLPLLNAGYEFTVTFNVDGHTAVFNTKKKDGCKRFLSIMYDPKIDVVCLFCDGETGADSIKHTITSDMITKDPLLVISDLIGNWKRFARR